MLARKYFEINSINTLAHISIIKNIEEHNSNTKQTSLYDEY